MHVFLLFVDTVAALLGGGLAASLLGLDEPIDWTLAAGLLAAADVLLVSLVSGVILHRFTSGTVTALTLATLAALALAAARRRPRPPRPPAVAQLLRRLAWWQRLLAAVAVAAIAWRVFLAVTIPPFAYDALAYHLTAVASWIQSGRIGVNPYAVCCGHYPSNAEVLFAWPTLLLHSDVLTQTVQVGAGVLGAIAVAGLARFVGASPPGAATAAALYLLCPIVLTQMNTNYNDVVVASLLLASLYYTTRFHRSGRRAHLVLAGVSLGLLLGTKLDALAMVAILLVVLVVQLIRRHRTAELALLVAPLALLGAWWYVRNWVDNGNPVWPVRVTGLFAGPRSANSYLTHPPGANRDPLVEVARSWYHDLVFWTRHHYSYESRDGGLGPVWSWIGWWAVLALAVDSVRRRRDVAFTVLAPLALVFAVEPYRWWSRFTIYLAALGAIAIVVLYERLRARQAGRLLAAAVVVLALGGVARATWFLSPAGRAGDLSMARVVSVAAHRSRPHTVGDLFFPEYRWLDNVPGHATIAVETNAPSIRFVYPLFGSHLDRRVVQLLAPSPTGVERILRGGGPTYLFVEESGAYAHWARAQPGYRRVFRGRGVAVYRRTP